MRLLTFLLAFTTCGSFTIANEPLEYPQTRRGELIEELHGVAVPDPYRWLEEDVRESVEVAQWVKAQQDFAREYLDALPRRDALRDRLEKLWNYERFSLPRRAGERYLFTKNDGLQDQSVLYIADSPEGAGEVLLNPNKWSDDGTVALTGYKPTDDGKLLAYLKSEAGSDWRTIHLLNLETGEKLEEVIPWVKFTGIDWTKDGRGFYYNRYPEPEEGEDFQQLALNQKVYFHRIGDNPADDTLIHEDPEHPDWKSSVEPTDDGSLLVLTISRGTDRKNKLYYKPAGDVPLSQQPTGQGDWRPLIEDFDNHFYFVGEHDGRMLLFTDYEAPNKRVVAMDVEKPGRDALVEVIPATDDVIEDISYVGGKLFAVRLADVATKVEVFSPTGAREREIELPGVGSAYGFSGKPDDDATFYGFSSYNRPSTSYRYDIASGESQKIREPKTPFDPNDYEVTRDFYTSTDGQQVPMFITHRKGLVRDHSHPTLLYGYGGFNISLTPGYSPSRMAWLENGGVLAVANLRGGGEYGEAWHLAGKLHNKQQVFDDFIAAAEHLVATGYTSPERLGIQGGSNGGLLVGAVLVQRPELFGAALPAVGVLDMLRFHKFTAGQFWRDEYGSADNAADFPVLLGYSPYHNVKPGHYPPTMVITADTDDRVVPMHSFKFAAAMQAAQAGEAPILLRVETRAGHGAGTPVSKRIEQAVDQWTFLLEHLTTPQQE